MKSLRKIFLYLCCTVLASVISAQEAQLSIEDKVDSSGQWIIKLNGGDAIISGCNIRGEKKIVIPETIDGATVVEIGDEAFFDKDAWLNDRPSVFAEMETITLPKTLKVIGRYAFRCCTSLKKLEVPEGVNVIMVRAFNDCTSLESVSLPESLEFMGDEVFKGCSSLKTISIPARLGTLPRGTVFYCGQLESINIPEGTKDIGNYACYDCALLESLKIPSTVDTIGNSAFEGCMSLKSVTLPPSVGYIGESAFRNCESLSVVRIPKTAFYEESAFPKSTELVFYEGEMPEDEIHASDESSYAEKLIREIVEMENRTLIKIKESRIVNGPENGIAYATDGENLFFISNGEPYTYYRVKSNDPDVPNFIYLQYMPEAYRRNSIFATDAVESIDLSKLDAASLYREIDTSNLSYITFVDLGEEPYQVLCSEIKIQENTEHPVDDIPPYTKKEVEEMIRTLVQRFESADYPSLERTDKPYAIKSNETESIFESAFYGAYVSTGTPFCFVSFYRGDTRNLMTLFFSRGTELEDLFNLSAEAAAFTDEETMSDAHEKGRLFWTDAEIEAYCNEFLESGKWCLSEKVTVNGIEYDMFCFPMHSGDYTPEM